MCYIRIKASVCVCVCDLRSPVSPIWTDSNVFKTSRNPIFVNISKRKPPRCYVGIHFSLVFGAEHQRWFDQFFILKNSLMCQRIPNLTPHILSAANKLVKWSLDCVCGLGFFGWLDRMFYISWVLFCGEYLARSYSTVMHVPLNLTPWYGMSMCWRVKLLSIDIFCSSVIYYFDPFCQEMRMQFALMDGSLLRHSRHSQQVWWISIKFGTHICACHKSFICYSQMLKGLLFLNDVSHCLSHFTKPFFYK